MSPNRLSPTFLHHSRSTKNEKPPQQHQQPFASSSHTMGRNLDTEPQSAAAEAQPVATEAQSVTPEPQSVAPEPQSVAPEPQSITAEPPTAPEHESPLTPPPEADSVPDVPTSPDSSVTAPSISSTTEPSDTPEVPRCEGPLSSLAHKAADTQLGRAASQNMPHSARPTLHRASRVLNTVDEHLLAAKATLDTDEGRRVAKSACEFASSLVAFIAMLFTAAVSSAERKLAMHPTEETTPKRFVKVCREATNRVRTCAETREKRVDGSCEARIYAHARQAADVMCSAFKSCLKGMSEFKGPGNEYVTPAAEKVISVLPEDMQVSVHQSQGPIESLRSGLGFESETCSASHDSSSAATQGTNDEGSRMKVD